MTLLIGALIAGGLYGLGGALQTEVQGYADITMGIGSVIIAVAAIFLDELLFPPRGRVAAGLAAIVVGGFLYTTILTVALRSGLPPTDLRLATAAILVAAVMISRAGIQTSVRNGLHAVAAFRMQRGRKSRHLRLAMPISEPVQTCHNQSIGPKAHDQYPYRASQRLSAPHRPPKALPICDKSTKAAGLFVSFVFTCVVVYKGELFLALTGPSDHAWREGKCWKPMGGMHLGSRRGRQLVAKGATRP